MYTTSVQCTTAPNYVIPIPTHGSCTICLWHSLAASSTKYSNICQVLLHLAWKSLWGKHIISRWPTLSTNFLAPHMVLVLQLDIELSKIVIYHKKTVGCSVTWWRDHSRMSLCLGSSANVVLTLHCTKKEIRTAMPARRKIFSEVLSTGLIYLEWVKSAIFSSHICFQQYFHWIVSRSLGWFSL